jgi:hypothetical protein
MSKRSAISEGFARASDKMFYINILQAYSSSCPADAPARIMFHLGARLLVQRDRNNDK